MRNENFRRGAINTYGHKGILSDTTGVVGEKSWSWRMEFDCRVEHVERVD